MKRPWLALCLGILLGVAVTVVGLAQAGRIAPAQPKAVVALAQLVEVEHRRVDAMLARGDVAGAIRTLEVLGRGPWLARSEGGDLAVQLRHDAVGRLIRLRLDHPEVAPVSAAELEAAVDQALGPDFPAVDTNPFTARLVGLRAEVLELQHRDDAALAAYDQALEMNRVLLDRALETP